MGHDYITLIGCFEDLGGVKEFDLGGNIIKVQPARDWPQVCCSIWQNMDYELEREKKQIGPSASIDDIFPSLTPEFRPQLFHYYVNEEGRAAVAWRVPCIAGGPYLKSLMVALMMWNGIADFKPDSKADEKHFWKMLGYGPSPSSIEGLDIFLWGYISDGEKLILEQGKCRRSSSSISSLSQIFSGTNRHAVGALYS